MPRTSLHACLFAVTLIVGAAYSEVAPPMSKLSPPQAITMPTVAAPAGSSLPATPPAQTDKFTLEFKSYMDFYYRLDTDGENAFEVDNIYLGGKFRVSDDLLFRGRMESDSTATRIKYAYLDWAPKDIHDRVIFGIHSDPYHEASEEIWNLRYVHKVLGDDAGAYTSTDMGLLYTRTFDKSSISLRVTNGEGYKAVEDDDYKAYQLALSLRPPNNVPRILKGLGLDISAITNREDVADVREEDDAYLALVSYTDKGVRLGFEYFITRRGFQGEGWSAYLIAPLGPKFEFFARYDSVNPDLTTPADEYSLILGGVSGRIHEGVRSALSYSFVDDDAAGGTKQIKLSLELCW